MVTQRGFSSFGILIITAIGLLAVGGGAYYYSSVQPSREVVTEEERAPEEVEERITIQATTSPSKSSVAKEGYVFSDYGISFVYPQHVTPERQENGWKALSNGGIDVYFRSITGKSPHAFRFSYPCDYSCNGNRDDIEVQSNATFNGFVFKKIAARSTNNPYYPKQGYLSYVYTDPVKNVDLYSFSFHYGGMDFYGDYEEAKAASDLIMNSIKISNYDHTDAYRVILNKPPVISSFTGPALIEAGDSGTWKAVVTDPESDKLQYVVRWGDEPDHADLVYPFNWPSEGFATAYSTTTFTHAYKKPGTYTATVYAVDNDINHVAEKTFTIRVTR